MNTDTGDGLAARRAALDLLAAVLRRTRPLDEAVARHEGLAALAPRDRAFARRIVATTLRRLGQIDALIDHCLDRGLPEKATRPRDILRIGVAQIVFLETPAHAAVDRTVSLVHGRAAAPYRGLINAVLRRIAREGAALAGDQDAARLNTPDWLWRSWSERFGEPVCRRIAEAHLADPPLDLTLRGAAGDWPARLDGTLLPGGSVRRAAGGGPVTELSGFDAGEWWVQDAAAALPARLLIARLDAASRVADLCAAPGGKTAQLAAAGLAVTAVDRSQGRLERVTENLARLRLDADLVVADVAKFRPEAPFAGVLLDAPCTATGTIRRHPDVARLKTAADVGRMVETQARLLAAAAGMVAPGGILVYSVCSLEAEEGPARIARFLAAGAPFERLPVTPDEAGGLAECITADGDLLTLPCHLSDRGGMDGFYAARLLAGSRRS